MRFVICVAAVLAVGACTHNDSAADSAGELVCAEAPECPESENAYTASDTPCGEDDGGCVEATACGETIYCRPTGV